MTGSPLAPLIWLLAAALFYVLTGGSVVILSAAFRARRPVRGRAFAATLITLAVGLTVTWSQRERPGFACVAELTAIVVLLLVYRYGLRPVLGWRDFAAMRETGRHTTLHLILITGSIIFLVPFAWLVVTSLKEESEMSKFPPVWIPTQQVEQVVDGKECGLARTSFRGKPVVVAVHDEYDTGERRVRILTPAGLAGTYFTCTKTALTEIRHTAPVFKNYPDAVKFLPAETGHGAIFLWNTVYVTALTVLGTLFASSAVAYSFARLRWPGRDSMFVVLMATMMLPTAVTMMPLFLIFRSLGWIDTLRPLWVPSFFGAAFNIFLLRQFYLGIPTELEDAAKIDGCSHYGIFWRVMLPQVKPALAALTIMAFMGAWNDFRNPLIYISSPEKLTLAYGLQLYQTAHGSEPGLMMAASSMVMVPVLLLFFFTQRYFIQGITLTGIKG